MEGKQEMSLRSGANNSIIFQANEKPLELLLSHGIFLFMFHFSHNTPEHSIGANLNVLEAWNNMFALTASSVRE
jgi:hypothetical protein